MYIYIYICMHIQVTLAGCFQLGSLRRAVEQFVPAVFVPSLLHEAARRVQVPDYEGLRPQKP